MAEIYGRHYPKHCRHIFTLPDTFAATAGGLISIGNIDAYPTPIDNRIRICVQNADGSAAPVAQPIGFGPGGILNMMGRWQAL
ncbi:hypothetical protein GRH90_24565 [Enterobacteriales bacterium SAP-6]|uniref:Bacteriophage P22 tailspike N-terminal domain-containing protein n=1 Tax=Acerihabitans arboris TaxID=2691583 RepID=A0A845SPA2_9GAMM|nr:hypothetical protein [Acerihabitans arboris]